MGALKRHTPWHHFYNLAIEVYNLALALARDSQFQEVAHLREAYGPYIQFAEKEIAPIEERLHTDQQLPALHRETINRLSASNHMREGAWWTENKVKIERAEDLFGDLEDCLEQRKALKAPTKEPSSSQSKGKKRRDASRSDSPGQITNLVNRLRIRKT